MSDNIQNNTNQKDDFGDIRSRMEDSREKDLKAAIEQGVILERLNNLISQNNTDHKLILEQTTKTNGRVNNLQSFRDKVTGALIVMNIFFVPIIMWLLYRQLEK